MQLQSLLDKFDLKLDDLNAAERATYFEWMNKLAKQETTVASLKEHVASLVAAVSNELAGIEEPKHFWSWLFQRRRHLYLQARLKNYLMLQDYLAGPDRAKKWVEQQLSNIKPT